LTQSRLAQSWLAQSWLAQSRLSLTELAGPTLALGALARCRDRTAQRLQFLVWLLYRHPGWVTA